MKRLIVIALGGALAACSGGDHEGLREWMQENTKDMRGNVPKLPEVKPYEPVPYGVEAMLDPFKPGKIEPESKQKQGGKGGAFQPDFEAREIRNSLLEKYPLESLKMIGFMNVNNRPIAVIQAEQNIIKQVKIGEYMGFDFGMVTKISETEVTVRELVQDSAGDWSERTSSLHLQGKEGSKQ